MEGRRRAAGFHRKLLPLIIGLELAIDRVEAVRKLSQESRPEGRDGVIAGFAASVDPVREGLSVKMSGN